MMLVFRRATVAGRRLMSVKVTSKTTFEDLFPLKDLHGKPIEYSSVKGKVVLIENVAAL